VRSDYNCVHSRLAVVRMYSYMNRQKITESVTRLDQFFCCVTCEYLNMRDMIMLKPARSELVFDTAIIMDS